MSSSMYSLACVRWCLLYNNQAPLYVINFLKKGKLGSIQDFTFVQKNGGMRSEGFLA